MSISYSKIWVHAVWSTKNRMSLIHKGMEQKLFNFLKEELKKSGCIVSIVNGMPDHVHCLFGINPQKSIIDINNLSSINKIELRPLINNELRIILLKINRDKSRKDCEVNRCLSTG